MAVDFAEWDGDHGTTADGPVPDFVRAGGDCICHVCTHPFWRHPPALNYPGYDGRPYLKLLCDGRLVKL